MRMSKLHSAFRLANQRRLNSRDWRGDTGPNIKGGFDANSFAWNHIGANGTTEKKIPPPLSLISLAPNVQIMFRPTHLGPVGEEGGGARRSPHQFLAYRWPGPGSAETAQGPLKEGANRVKPAREGGGQWLLVCIWEKRGWKQFKQIELLPRGWWNAGDCRNSSHNHSPASPFVLIVTSAFRHFQFARNVALTHKR